MQELMAIENQRGVQQAAQHLLLRLPHRRENYFTDLMYALKEAGYVDLVHPDLLSAS